MGRPFVDHRLGWAAVFLALGACSPSPVGEPDDGSPAGAASQRGAATEQIVARVDGHAITVGQVQELIDEADAGLPPTAALDALVRQQLLAVEARRRGFDASREVRHARRAALARRLLEREASRVTVDSLDQRRLAEIYEQQRERFTHGPLRKIVHAVVRTGKGGVEPAAAAAAARRIAVAVREAHTEEAFRAAAEQLAEQLGGALKVESLPPFPAETKRFVAPFVAAAFAIEAPGQVSPPIETSFGWHVLLFVEELPGRDTPAAEARAIIGQQLLPEERRQRVERLLEQLEQRRGISVDERALAPVDSR